MEGNVVAKMKDKDHAWTCALILYRRNVEKISVLILDDGVNS